jgi:hypothetical protein
MLIGLTGKAGAGKDTVADIITTLIPAEVYHFADPVRQMAYVLDPIVCGFDESPLRLSEVVDTIGWNRAKVEYPEVRRTLQRLGTECVRGIFGENAWVDLAAQWWHAGGEKRYLAYPHAVIADTRFPNEAAFIRSENGVIVKVVRPTGAHDLGVNASHASEQELDSDFVLVNDSDLGALQLKVWGLLEELGIETS